VLGAGAFGTALAISLARSRPTTLWARTGAQGMHKTRLAPRLPGVTLPDTLHVTGDLDDITADTLLLAVPLQHLRGLIEAQRGYLKGKRLVACCKGLEIGSGLGPVALLRDLMPDETAALLTGPSFAADIARGLPTALTLACADADAGRALQTSLTTANLRLYRSTDWRGAELGGALKNVMAIACGAAMGAGLGDSARAALLTRGFAEMQRIAVHQGAQPETLAGLSGLGDLVLTCTSDLSRNYRLGHALGQAAAFDARITVEGVATAQAMQMVAQRLDIEVPITDTIVALTGGTLDVTEAMTRLLSRPLKEE